jgi:prevent-host-death family protein
MIYANFLEWLRQKKQNYSLSKTLQMMRLSISKLRNQIAECADMVQNHGDRIIVCRNGSPAFAIVPLEDANLLKAIESKLDVTAIECRKKHHHQR